MCYRKRITLQSNTFTKLPLKMALLPLLFHDFSRPSPRENWISVFGQPEELLHPLRNVLNQIAALDKDSSIQVDKDKFQANVDIQQFKPEEITVRLEGDNTVIVEGKHEEKQDEHGFISRHFVRRYVLPDDVDALKVQSKLSSDGVLSISAPKKPEGNQIESKQIPISLTGPLRSVEQKGQQGEAKNQ